RRRLRCLPRPAASSISRRLSRGLEVTIASTRPCEMIEWVSLPKPVSESISITSVRRQRAPFSWYPPSPARSRRRTIEISLSGTSTAPSELSSTISTSALVRACTPRPPPKITSCIDCPRTASGDCSPITHRTASVMLDLPDPFGPTTTLTPGPKSRRVRSGKDLTPLKLSDFRCPPVPLALQSVDRLASGLLLGLLLAPAAPPAELPAGDERDHLEGALVRRAVLAGNLVVPFRAAPSQQLLQGRLEVDRMLERLLDLRFEGLHHRRGGPLVAGVQVAGSDDGLGHRREHALGLHQDGRALLGTVGRRGAEPLGQPEALGDL